MIGKILIIEKDDKKLSLQVKKIIKKRSVELEIVSNNKIDVNKLGKNPPDLIVLNYDFQKGLNQGFLKKTDFENCTIPIVIMLNRENENTVEEMRKFGAKDCIVKKDNYHEFLPQILGNLVLQTKLEKSLRIEREKAHKYLEIAGVMLFTLDCKGTVTLINKKGCRVLGYEENEIIGKNWFDNFLPDRNKKEVKEIFEKILKGEKESIEYFKNPVLTKDGKEKYIAWRNVILTDESGRITGTLSSGEDITDRLKAEEALLEERTKLKTKLKHVSLLADITSRLNFTDSFVDIIDELLVTIAITLNLDKVYLYNFESGFYNIPYCIESLKSGDSRKCDFEPASFSAIDEIVYKLKRGEIVQFSDLSGKKRKIKDFYLQQKIKSAIMFPIQVADRITGFICFSHNHVYEWNSDIVELLKTISEIIATSWERHHHSQARLESEKKRTEAVQMAEKAMRLASIGTLAGGIAHEINQPLNALTFAVDGMLYWQKRKKKFTTEELLKKLNFISDQSARIDDIIQQMRVLAKQEKGSQPSKIDINNVIRRALSIIGQQLSVHGIKVILKPAITLPNVYGNSTQLEQVIINIVVNAMHALDTIIKPDKIITILTSSDDKNCKIEISDNGPGIKPEHLLRIFDPFFTTRAEGESMGFGLSISQNIISEMEGTISVKNNPEGGAHFSIEIPAISEKQGN